MLAAINELPFMSLSRGAWLNTGYSFMVLYLIEHRDNLTFALYRKIDSSSCFDVTSR
jgi:hypothetical protein